MEILMQLKGAVLGLHDVLALMGFFGLLKAVVFSAILLAQASSSVEAIQQVQSEQETRITRLEDWQRTLEMIRNFEYGALLVIGGFITWFLKETAKNTNRIAVLGAGHGHHDSAIGRIEQKLDRLVDSARAREG